MRISSLAYCALVSLAGCGAATPSTTATSGTSPRSPEPRPASSGTPCPVTDYAPPLGCYFDVESDTIQNGVLTISDRATLAQYLLPYPPEANRPPCDPAAAAQAVDFTRSRIHYVRVEAAGRRILQPAGTCGAGVTLTIDVGPECGGAERGPGFLLVVVPVGGPIRVVDTAPTECPSYEGDPPA